MLSMPQGINVFERPLFANHSDKLRSAEGITNVFERPLFANHSPVAHSERQVFNVFERP